MPDCEPCDGMRPDNSHNFRRSSAAASSKSLGNALSPTETQSTAAMSCTSPSSASCAAAMSSLATESEMVSVRSPPSDESESTVPRGKLNAGAPPECDAGGVCSLATIGSTGRGEQTTSREMALKMKPNEQRFVCGLLSLRLRRLMVAQRSRRQARGLGSAPRPDRNWRLPQVASGGIVYGTTIRQLVQDVRRDDSRKQARRTLKRITKLLAAPAHSAERVQGMDREHLCNGLLSRTVVAAHKEPCYGYWSKTGFANVCIGATAAVLVACKLSRAATEDGGGENASEVDRDDRVDRDGQDASYATTTASALGALASALRSWPLDGFNCEEGTAARHAELRLCERAHAAARRCVTESAFATAHDRICQSAWPSGGVCDSLSHVVMCDAIASGRRVACDGAIPLPLEHRPFDAIVTTRSCADDASSTCPSSSSSGSSWMSTGSMSQADDEDDWGLRRGVDGIVRVTDR